MSDHHEPINMNPENTNPDWTDEDINLKSVGVYCFIVVAITAAVFIGMLVMFKSYDAKEGDAKKAGVSELAQKRSLPKGNVLLQVRASKDLETYLAQEEFIQHNVGFVDGTHTTAYVPISIAIEHVAAHGFTPITEVKMPAAHHDETGHGEHAAHETEPHEVKKDLEEKAETTVKAVEDKHEDVKVAAEKAVAEHTEKAHGTPADAKH